MAQKFIGVYATSEKAPSLGEFPRPMVKRKRLWFVWETSEGKYKVQALNAVFQPMAEARFISLREFEERFTLEKDCGAAPEGYVSPVAAADPSAFGVGAGALPDLFMETQGRPAPTGEAGGMPPVAVDSDPNAVRADDPNLLSAWVKSEGRVRRRVSDPAKMPFDRLVGEVAEEKRAEQQGTAGFGPPSAHGSTVPLTTSDAEHVRQLRSQFVQALLLLRRGARTESIALLREMLGRQHTFFEGGAQLFSEFGLGLRRLGLISLALAAHKRALEFSPRDERVLFNIARSYHDLDLLPEARDYLMQALEVAPDFTVARQFLGFLDSNDQGKTEKKS